MIEFLSAHLFWVGVGALWLYSAIVSNMPAPDNTTGKGYLWVYGTLHTLAGNLNNTFGGKLPGQLKLFAVMALLPLMLLVPACHGYQVHPGAPNPTASKAYDSLIVASGAIDAAKAQMASGTLPQSFKPALNGTIRSYQLAKSSLQLYSDAVSKGQPADIYLRNLTADIAALETKVLALKGGK